MGKWGKYSNKYQKAWEELPEFKNWLTRTPETLLNAGMQDAYCKLCNCCLRPYKTDLLDHRKSRKHVLKESAIPSVTSNKQSTLLSHGFKAKTAESKTIDLRLSVHIACHSSVRTVDHLGEMLKTMAPGTKLADFRRQRTKYAKLITKVVSPCIMQDVKEDLGDEWCSLILDESTDHTTSKFLAIMIKFYSKSRGDHRVEFLGLIETPSATAEALHTALKQFLIERLGLNLKRLFALGTDGGLNLCGAHHSVFACWKRDCPNLHLVKCICHGLDKSASYASRELPSSLEFMIRESRNWFSHSALRKMVYSNKYKGLTGGQEPPLLVKLAATRWLSFHGAVKTHLDQYSQLQHLFKKTAIEDEQKQQCPMAHRLAELHEDLLYLTFLKPVLRELTSINVVFQSTTADFVKVYSELKVYLFTLARSVLRQESLMQGQPGMLRLTELQALKVALLRPDNVKPLELVNYGSKFWQTATTLNLPQEKLREVQQKCTNFLLVLLKELTNRLPSCIEDVEKLRFFSPVTALCARGRPDFKNLPLDLVRDASIDLEEMETQWNKLVNFKLEDIIPGENDAAEINITKFWFAVSRLKNGAGQLVFKDLARFVLTALTLPLSNAVVERLFSLLTIVKDKLRNRMGLDLLQAILRIRVFLKGQRICCGEFQPSKAMTDNFTAKNMYVEKKKPATEPEPGTSAETVDDPDPSEPLGEIPGLTIDDRDIDDLQAAHPLPEWDDMLALLEEVDRDVAFF